MAVNLQCAVGTEEIARKGPADVDERIKLIADCCTRHEREATGAICQLEL